MRRTFYHGVSQSLFLLMINDRKSTPCYSVSSVVSFDIPVLNEMSETFVIFCLLCLWYICCLFCHIALS